MFWNGLDIRTNILLSQNAINYIFLQSTARLKLFLMMCKFSFQNHIHYFLIEWCMGKAMNMKTDAYDRIHYKHAPAL